MDVVTLGAPGHTVTADANIIRQIGPFYGLYIKTVKWEVITITESADVLTDFRHETQQPATLLGAPFLSGVSHGCYTVRFDDLTRALSSLQLISSHDAMIVLKTSLSAPRLHYVLLMGHHQLIALDRYLRDALSKLCKTAL